jgi:murein DD-endopeptidase MepM/ murein hydrolase activator NlpD
MAKQKFKYNPKTLSYEKVSLTFKDRFVKAMLFIAPTLVLSIIFGLFLAYRIESPKQRKLQEELATINRELITWQRRLSVLEEVSVVLQKRDEELYRAALGAKSFPEELRLMGIGGSDRYSHLQNKSNAEILVSTAKKLDLLESRMHAQNLSFNELVELSKEREKRLSSLPAIQPVRNSDLKRLASGYGWRIDPVYGTRKMHWGLDFTAEVGTEIYATGDGIVEEVKTSNWGYGREIVINHGFGYQTRYAHLYEFKVKEGDQVKRGDLIALMGSTGKSTGSHLHYEVMKDGKKVNPINFFHSDLTPEQFEAIIEISNNALKSMD